MQTEATLPPLFIKGNEKANDGGIRCLRCGKQIKGNPVQVFQDFRIGGEFHDFGGIPDEERDGPYTVGPECADALRLRARFYLYKAGIAPNDADNES